MKVLKKCIPVLRKKSMTCVWEKIRLIVVPLWVCHCHSPFQQQEWAVLIWKDKLTGDLCASVKTQKISAKTCCYTNQWEIKTYPRVQKHQCFLIVLSQNHRILWVGRDLFIQKVYLLTQYMETTEENYKEIIYLEPELY